LRSLARSLFSLLLAAPAFAGEGKWTPQQVLAQGPEWVKAQGFGLPLERLWDEKAGGGLLANAVQLPGCSGSFVSAEGLLITNHHCVVGIVQEHSTPQANLGRDGYVARTRAEEKPAKAYRVQVPRGFRDVTRENVGNRMAILLFEKGKGEVVTAPVIRTEIGGGRVQISGRMSTVEASDIALLLRAGSLAAPMEIVEERTVGPSLGRENIEKGFRSTVWGFAAIAAFMIVYYVLFGVFSSLALGVNLLLLIALLSLLQATLTLPGIAAIALTLGMAIDANVLINERIREELRAGQTPQAAIHAGYERAFGTIVDSNVTTLIAGLALADDFTNTANASLFTNRAGDITSSVTSIRRPSNAIIGRKAAATSVEVNLKASTATTRRFGNASGIFSLKMTSDTLLRIVASDVSQPTASELGACGINPAELTRPCVGRMPYTPQKLAGTRTEPPVSEPSAKSQRLPATAAAEPDDDPPGTRSGASVFSGVPSNLLSPRMPSEISSVIVLPTRVAPASSSVCTAHACSEGI